MHNASLILKVAAIILWGLSTFPSVKLPFRSVVAGLTLWAISTLV